MKRLLYTLLLLTLVGCSKQTAEPADGALGTATLHISMATASRVAFGDSNYSWEGNEQLGLYVASATPTVNSRAEVSVVDGVGYCTPSINSYAAGDMLYCYQPYNAKGGAATAVAMAIPTTQSVKGAGHFLGEAMPMVADGCALGTDGQISLLFHPLAAFLRYNIYASGQYADEKVVSVRYATSTPLAGEFTFDITSAERTLPRLSSYAVSVELESAYQLTASEQSATPIYMVVAPGDYRGTLVVTTDKAIYSYNYNRTTERNTYYDVNIDLSKATYRKALTQTTAVVATLTYSECSSKVTGYGKVNSYTNSFGTWTLCAYNHSNVAIQINGGKVAYIGTPTFESSVTSLTLTLSESYSDKLYICSAAGSSSATSIVDTFKVSGSTITVDLSSYNINKFYIRSESCMRIKTVSVTYGKSSGTVLPDPTPDPEPTPDPDPTPEPDPTPDPDPTPTPTPTSRYSWAELPVIADADGNGVDDNDSNIYYAHHLCNGGEKNAQKTDTARNFTVCYSGTHHCPLWVAAPRHSMYEVKNTSRTDAYGQDPNIPSSVQYTSKSTGGGCNKGHMLGSAERLSSAATNRQVFYYTNIAPQYSSTFNTGGGAWNNLEDHIDGLVCSDTLYVVVGCYFKQFSRNGASASPSTISFGGRNDVSCPTMFYYALLRTKKGNSGKSVQQCAASELQCAAFTICHKMAKGHKPEAADMMSITELEALTGFTYFDNVPNAPKSSFSASDWL